MSRLMIAAERMAEAVIRHTEKIAELREAERVRKLEALRASLQKISDDGFKEGVEYFCEFVNAFGEPMELMARVSDVLAASELEWHDMIYHRPIAKLIRRVTKEPSKSFWEWYDYVPRRARRAFFAGFVQGLNHAASRACVFADVI